MTTIHNPYATPAELEISASQDDYAEAMQGTSPSNASEATQTTNSHEQGLSQLANSQEKLDSAAPGETIDIEEEDDENLPPSFYRMLTEDSLRDNQRLHVFWATLRIPIPLKPDDSVTAMFEALECFLTFMTDEDPYFTVFYHNLSKFEDRVDLPPPIEGPDTLPLDVDEWLQYFPQAHPQARGGDTYTSVLIGCQVPFTKLIKSTAHWLRTNKFGLWQSTLQTEKPTSAGWLLFSTQSMDIEILCGKISNAIAGIPIGLRWKMIGMGAQGSIPKDQQVKALHILVDELDMPRAKPLLMGLYSNKLEAGHTFPLGIRMRLVPEIETVLNMKGRANVERLRACQNTWNTSKLAYIKTWEIELLDHYNGDLKLSLRGAMMTIKHPTNAKFNLFHSIDRHRLEKCHMLTVLKSAESAARAMIAAMLPYLLWKLGKDARSKSTIAKWFKPAARARAADAYWDEKEECVKNTSDLMLTEAMADDDDLYWEVDKVPESPKRKQVQIEEESLDDSVPTVQTAASAKKGCKAAKLTSESTAQQTNKDHKDSQTVTSQSTTISILTTQVQEIQQTNNTILERFDMLAKQMATLMASSSSSVHTPAGGHISGSGQQK